MYWALLRPLVRDESKGLVDTLGPYCNSMHLRSIPTFAFALAIATFVVPACRNHTRTPVIGGPPMVIEVALT
ncbi:MAG: hypothetical protein OEZ09_14015, partial [Betaproteobacteria bacterium]|nr:hypothetical protein [Betaproteobacteria bacterium]